MYYPFLRARQFELIALRELANEDATQGVIIPILEPVMDTQSGLNLAHKVFVEKKQHAYLVVNSDLGNLNGEPSLFLEYLKGLHDCSYKVAFHYRNNASEIKDSIAFYNLSDCMLICSKDLDSDDKEFQELAQFPSISTFTVEDPGRNRSLDRFIKRLGKNYIRLDDLFEKQERNSEFLNIAEHRFSEEHIWIKEDGIFTGFSDYTTLPSEFIEGGSTPRAVVIHWTYLNEKEEIWIKHFTSITNDTIADVQGKFGEAAEKAVKFIELKNIKNSAAEELKDYFIRGHYPGLGMVKKISIKNHLLIISNYLKKQFNQ
jgi:hypothetical protein